MIKKVFFTGNIHIYYENGTKALQIIALSNIYICFQQHLYTVSPEGLNGTIFVDKKIEMKNLKELRKFDRDDTYYDERDMQVVELKKSDNHDDTILTSDNDL